MSYKDAKRPNSAVYYRNEIYVKDDGGIHKFQFDLAKNVVIYKCKLVTMEETSPGIGSFIDEYGILNLAVLSTKQKRLYPRVCQIRIIWRTSESSSRDKFETIYYQIPKLSSLTIG